MSNGNRIDVQVTTLNIEHYLHDENYPRMNTIAVAINPLRIIHKVQYFVLDDSEHSYKYFCYTHRKMSMYLSAAVNSDNGDHHVPVRIVDEKNYWKEDYFIKKLNESHSHLSVEHDKEEKPHGLGSAATTPILHT